MKKVLAVFLSLLIVFSACSVAAFAEDQETTTQEAESTVELVFPTNFKQLKSAFIFKLFEKMIKLILGFFGMDDFGSIDTSLAEQISSIGGEVQSAIEEGSKFLENNQ